MVAGNDFHGLFDQFVTLVFETLLVAVFTSVDTTTKIVVLGRRRRRSEDCKYRLVDR